MNKVYKSTKQKGFSKNSYAMYFGDCYYRGVLRNIRYCQLQTIQPVISSDENDHCKLIRQCVRLDKASLV